MYKKKITLKKKNITLKKNETSYVSAFFILYLAFIHRNNNIIHPGSYYTRNMKNLARDIKYDIQSIVKNPMQLTKEEFTTQFSRLLSPSTFRTQGVSKMPQKAI